MPKCRFFLKGCCRAGPQCRFFHPSPTNPSRDVRDKNPSRTKIPKVSKTEDGWTHMEFKKPPKTSRPSASSKQVVKNPFQAFAEVMGEEPKQLPTTRKKSWVEMMEEEEAEYTEDEKYAMLVHQSALLARYR